MSAFVLNAQRVGVILIASLLFMMMPAQAETSPTATIDSQIKAFLADDDAGAYSHAAPNVKRFFPTVDRFMGMVKGGYQPVYRPETWSFGRSQTLEGGRHIQEVLILDQNGKNWRAIYTLETIEGDWKITGVSLQASEEFTM